MGDGRREFEAEAKAKVAGIRLIDCESKNFKSSNKQAVPAAMQIIPWIFLWLPFVLPFPVF